METELTLKLDRAIIDSAKNYARNNNKDLSGLVEAFFKTLTDEHSSTDKYPPLIQQLSGIITEADLERVSREDEKVRYILRDGI
ncbi:hypothetical protein R80B4_03064 [Fibrobacteres bacterium R8-0-B4]